MEHHLQTTRTARYFTHGTLSGATKCVWIVLHGYAQLAKDFILPFEALDHTHFIIAPEGLNRFYAKGLGGKPVATWMTSEDRLNEIKDYIAFLDRVYADLQLEHSRAKIIVLGFSQGVATASRWIAATPCRVDHFVICSGELGSELQTDIPQKIKDLHLTYITGTRDPLITPGKHAHVYAIMRSLDANIIEFEGKHELPQEVIMQLAAQLSGAGSKNTAQ